jgi:3-oxoacyl-[acyl-carrier-protein] synthase I
VSKDKANTQNIQIIGDASANDANHISGPSRTGEGLFKSIKAALEQAKVSANDIDYISAHGTATVFNDEMEAIAFTRSGLQHVPVNSFKGWYGHTLGASALLETILSKHSLLKDELYSSLNFDELGTSEKINVIEKARKKELKYALKTASGFGGCNLALVLKKDANG